MTPILAVSLRRNSALLMPRRFSHLYRRKRWISSCRIGPEASIRPTSSPGVRPFSFRDGSGVRAAKPAHQQMPFQGGQVLLHALPPEQLLDFAAEDRAHPLGCDVEECKDPTEHQRDSEFAPVLRERVDLAETHGAEGYHGHVERVPGRPILDQRIPDRPDADQGQRYDQRQDVAWCQDRTPGKDGLRSSFFGLVLGIVTAAGAEVSLLQQSPRIWREERGPRAGS